MQSPVRILMRWCEFFSGIGLLVTNRNGVFGKIVVVEMADGMVMGLSRCGR